MAYKMAPFEGQKHGVTEKWCTLSFMRVWLLALCCFAFVLPAPLAGQGSPVAPAIDYSGMYSFIRDGEFVQLTVEEKGKVTGFISRFGDSESDKGVFLNQFFKSGKLEEGKLSFTTEGVHGVWFEFSGTAARGPGKKPDEEAYCVLRGTLTRFSTDADKKTTSQARTVELKSFPRDTATQ
jgi:hypothetical protein